MSVAIKERTDRLKRNPGINCEGKERERNQLTSLKLKGRCAITSR